MKKFYIYVLLVLSLFLVCSCDFEINKDEKEEPIIPDVIEEKPVEEYNLKVSRLLNRVQKKENEFVQEQNIKDELVNASFKIYSILSSDVKENYSISPVSIYFALSLLYEIGDQTVKDEIEELLELSSNTLSSSGLIYKDLTWSIDYGKFMGNDKSLVSQPVSLSNSVWLDNNITKQVNKETLDTLALKHFCYAFETTFKDNNEQANKDIREFVKEQTNGLIDNDFDLHESTLFALINTLLFTDKWLEHGNLDTSTMDFKLSDGTTVNVKDAIGKYQNGLVYENNIGSGFYAETVEGYKLFFLVPNDGHEVSELMNNEFYQAVIKNMNNQPERDLNIIHKTRVIFPTFNVETAIECQEMFMNQGYLQHTFSSFNSSLILDQEVRVSRIIHQTNLKVDEEGIIGGAVTIIEGRATSAYAEYKYHDFVVNKNFGFVLTSFDGIIMFMGQITNPLK